MGARARRRAVLAMLLVRGAVATLLLVRGVAVATLLLVRVGCLSHVHAAKLLRNSTGISLRGLGSSGVCEIQCIVATEHTSAPWPKDETVEIS